ncbi:hypothetical protein MUN84_13160 [Hymenobacter sp. 5516J-16]|uniref:Roadblock/LAMTOR2 domain-containing protein n=1 Tax=Hymenobacter sublimis TaxID=2933777 RepID=A0ABY4JA26_9BACT|nr:MULTISPECIES: hypothetical protein [Hymenobacter]UOQ75626.1 hypothetical protein MUN84_13160 [Hymenobacter sp. 5516J-16]UPL49291.1 hypothetical protein MWH26_19195 [Hymenobacter sublimis]
MALPFLNRLQELVKPGPAPGESGQQAKAKARLEAIRAALPELLAVAVIDIDSGQALAAHSNSPKLAPAKAAAHNAEVVRQKRRAIQALALPDEKIEDILITLREQLHLLRVTHDERHLLYLVVSPQDTNLAIARDVLRTHSH